jgi:hypothetical protein
MVVLAQNKNEPGYSEPCSGGLVVAEDAGGTYPQGTITPKATDFMTWQLATQKLSQILHLRISFLTIKIAKESAMTVSPSTNAGAYLIGFNLSNSVSKDKEVKDSSQFQMNIHAPGLYGGHTSLRRTSELLYPKWKYLGLTARLRGDSPACIRTPVLARPARQIVFQKSECSCSAHTSEAGAHAGCRSDRVSHAG